MLDIKLLRNNFEEVEKALKETLNRLQQPKGKNNSAKYKRERREQEREKHELEIMEAGA